MQYHSTRDRACRSDGIGAILQGPAKDGGLFLPEEIPPFSWQDCASSDPLTMAQKILSAFLPDVPHMDQLVKKAYVGKFETEELTPTVPVGEFTVLELFRGPTCAFKDVALSVLPRLMTAAKAAKGQKKDLLILTATSGDTGKAALEGFRDVPGVRICVFYPENGVSPIQRRQMVCQEGSNVTVCAVRGNFDDAQTGVKNIFAACGERTLPFELSSANSINVGRLVPQITYYFKAYADLLARRQIRAHDTVNFAVPTGNFGNILAGYLAKRLGLPVGKLICASNANHVLTDFIRTGTYDRRRPLHKTDSPSMDILVSSNLERLLYFLSDDPALVADLMAKLNQEGTYTVPEELLRAIQAQFWGGFCDDSGAAETIRRVWETHRYLCDPHTAAGWAVAQDYGRQTGDTRPTVVLSTASPYKFPCAVLEALGGDTEGDEFQQMQRLEALTGVPIPAPLSTLRERPERHTRVIDKEEMASFVLSLGKENEK